MEPLLAEKTNAEVDSLSRPLPKIKIEKDQDKESTTTITTPEKVSSSPYQKSTDHSLDVQEPLPHKEGPRRSKRTRCPPAHFNRNADEIPDEDPTTYRQAVESSLKENWTMAMEDEINVLKKNNTFDVVDKPIGQNIVRSKWVFKTKKNADSALERF